MTRTVLVTGGGGVGKTTIAAALGVAAAQAGHTTLVLTVDPARRLATALGLDQLGNHPEPNPKLKGLSAAMLDSAASWDAIAFRHAPGEIAERLVTNPLFEAVATRFPSGQAYAAAEEMAVHLESGQWDVVVVDTPPASGGIEFFSAPRRMRELVGGRLLRWLTGAGLPGRRGLFNLAGRPALRLADALLGGPLLEQVAEFLFDLRTTYDGISAKAGVIEQHFDEAATLVVTTADPGPLREALRFHEVGIEPSLVVFNRALPREWASIAEPLEDGRAATALNDNLARWALEVRRQEDSRADFSGRVGTPIVTIPWLADAPVDLDGLRAVLSGAPTLTLDRLGI
ncbi:MAG: AAA family ATPase [Acidimicrobiia bacterium]|nr:AAA family ATPase [Acidimicrobiia bacterium]